jgi:tetratricopeptide (TPR) repeat protein
MRRVFERITARLRAFIQQRDNAALVVRCREAESVAILKILEGIEEESSSELFWTYLGDFVNDREYASEVVKDFANKHEGVAVAMERQAIKPWPPIPQVILDESLPAARRLRELMVFSRSLLPGTERCSVVWVLCPLNIADEPACAQLFRELLQHQFPFPWFHRIRLILREETEHPALSPVLGEIPRIEYYAPDLSDAALEAALEEEAADEELPLVDRIQAMFISAQRDIAYSRFDEALKKHEIVLRYHTAIDNPSMVALALNGVGEIHQRLGRLDQAGRCFETALEPATEGEHPPLPVFLNIVVNLANLRMGQKRYAEAEVYYDAAEKMATVQRNPPIKIQSIENLGYCHYIQGKVKEAVDTWKHGADIACKLKQPELQKSILSRLLQHFASTNHIAEQREIERQLASINSVALN